MIEKTLGKGGFAKVYLGSDNITGVKYAIKKMDKAKLMKRTHGDGSSAYNSVLEELKILQRLEHPNILWLHEVIDDPLSDQIYLVTEWQKNGSISSKIGKNV